MSKFLNLDAQKLYNAVKSLKDGEIPIEDFKNQLNDDEFDFLKNSVHFIQLCSGQMMARTHAKITDLGALSILGSQETFVGLIQQYYLLKFPNVSVEAKILKELK